ncbi:MAG TPA: non-heme iron oxygenase ferredoxin subunit [Steroidobacteraceae bacterium]|jgi:CDP-4-dehydro-6-deoxyglucose reductase|nr:non-heme iron oxygenase ferredoxin subunit [Steroidobacteraceae bacterium]
MSLHEVCKLEALALDAAHPVTVAGRAISLFRLEDGVFALRDRCTHGNGHLSAGYVEQGLIECPLHGGCFDIRTGEPRSGPVSIPVRRYRVIVEQGTVFIDIPDTASAVG